MGDHTEVLTGQIIDGLGVGGKLPALRQLQIENGDVQAALGGDFGIQLPQGAGGGVAGIGHQGLSLDLTLSVDLLEHLAGHIDLTPDDKAGQLFRQHHGNGADGAQILRHVLPYPAVTPGGAADKDAVTVLQRHRETVHLGLYTVFRLRQCIPETVKELPHLVSVEYILQTLQRHGMLHRFKLTESRAAHALGGRIGCDLLRVLPLQILQTTQHMVIFIIRNGRCVLHVVAVAVFIQLIAQAFHFLLIVHFITRCLRCNPVRIVPIRRVRC